MPAIPSAARKSGCTLNLLACPASFFVRAMLMRRTMGGCCQPAHQDEHRSILLSWRLVGSSARPPPHTLITHTTTTHTRLPPSRQGRLCLVLDLDHTLLNSATFTEVGPVLGELLESRAAAEAANLAPDRRLLFRMDAIKVGWSLLKWLDGVVAVEVVFVG